WVFHDRDSALRPRFTHQRHRCGGLRNPERRRHRSRHDQRLRLLWGRAGRRAAGVCEGAVGLGWHLPRLEHLDSHRRAVTAATMEQATQVSQQTADAV
ncbi:uncharacterized protein METZ01_LOCUS324590, partial [marine metagenome]